MTASLGWTLGFVSAVLLAVNPARAQSTPGYLTTVTVTFETDTDGRKQTQINTQATATHIRFDMSGGMLPVSVGETYAIYDIQMKTITSVIPKMKIATVIDMASAGRIAGTQLKTEFKGEPIFTVDDLGLGEAILGLPTHKYHIRSQVTTVTSLGAASCEKTVINESDLWNSTGIALPAGMHEAMSTITGSADPALLKLATLKREKMKGYTVREISTTTVRSSGGATQVTKGRSEMTAFSKGAIENSRFEIPADIQMMDPPNKMLDRLDPAMAEMMAGAMERASAVVMKKHCGATAPDSP